MKSISLIFLGLTYLASHSATSLDVGEGKFVTINPLEIMNADDTIESGEWRGRQMFSRRISFSWEESKVVNYLGFMHAHEYQPPWAAEYNPDIYMYGLLAGHQFRFRKWFLYMPVSLAASLNNGVRRGKFLRDTCTAISCSIPHDGDFRKLSFERKTFFVQPGLFVEVTPALIFGRFYFGFPVFWNYSPVGKTLGMGLTAGWNLSASLKKDK